MLGGLVFKRGVSHKTSFKVEIHVTITLKNAFLQTTYQNVTQDSLYSLYGYTFHIL